MSSNNDKLNILTLDLEHIAFLVFEASVSRRQCSFCLAPSLNLPQKASSQDFAASDFPAQVLKDPIARCVALDLLVNSPLFALLLPRIRASMDSYIKLIFSARTF